MIEKRTPNLRMSRRIEVSFPATFSAAGESAAGTVTQISEGGLLFVTPAVGLDIVREGALSLKAFAGEQDVELRGRLIYKLTKGRLTSYGVKFDSLTQEEGELVSRIIRFVTIRERHLRKARLVEDKGIV